VAKRAKLVTGDPSEVRRSEPLNSGMIDKLHLRLSGIQVELPDPDERKQRVSTRSIRALFAAIRRKRNQVGKVVGWLLPRHADVRADLVRIEKVIKAQTAEILRTDPPALRWANNVTEKQAAVREILSDWHEAKAELEVEAIALAEALAHSRWVREELKFAFEEASRSLATIELEWKFETK
jgi:hypothetical protein